MVDGNDELKAYGLGEFLEKKFETPNRIGCAEFIEENLTIRLCGIGAAPEGYFEVDATRGDLVWWLEHLNRKSWITSEMLGDFVRVWLSKKAEAK